MKFLVIDDHALIREAMLGVLGELSPHASVLEAASYGAALDLVAHNDDIRLVLLDLHLPDRHGLDVLSELRARFPAIAVVMLSAFNDRDNVLKALNGGALGFIPKTESRDVLLGALRLILAGGKYIPPDILGSTPLAQPAPPVPAVPDAAPRRPLTELGLTERQIEVLALMMQGKSNKLICRALSLAEPTVKNHVSAILKALGVSNRTEAVLAASELDWAERWPKP
ncbi:MAG: response regulator transcription factor [Hyphomicrobiaceae bacterium]|nr:response regulator transcription factor [Hyphomicrobiaceae bacterium]